MISGGDGSFLTALMMPSTSPTTTPTIHSAIPMVGLAAARIQAAIAVTTMVPSTVPVRTTTSSYVRRPISAGLADGIW